MKKESLKTFQQYKISTLSSIFGGTSGGSSISGELDMDSRIKGGVLNAAIGKSN